MDKTAFIKEWWENEDKGSLFEGLFIWQEEKYHALQGTYPVISLSFANVMETNYRDTRRKICQIIASE